jgi:hypothetical protein
LLRGARTSAAIEAAKRLPIFTIAGSGSPSLHTHCAPAFLHGKGGYKINAWLYYSLPCGLAQDALQPDRLSVLPPGTIPARNFFADFLASALHEDTRYRREGANHRFWHRMGYAINGAVVTRPDEGAGLTNIMPEFGPDVGRWFKRHLGFHHGFV